MTDPLSSTWRGRPTPLRPSWWLPVVSRRSRTALVLAAPVAVFTVLSVWSGDFLVALFGTTAATVVGAVLWLLLHVLRRVDSCEDETARLGRQITSHETFRREVHANTEDTARLSGRVRFLEEMTLGAPESRDDRRTS